MTITENAHTKYVAARGDKILNIAAGTAKMQQTRI